MRASGVASQADNSIPQNFTCLLLLAALKKPNRAEILAELRRIDVESLDDLDTCNRPDGPSGLYLGRESALPHY